MGTSNLALRPTAIPFRSLWYDDTSNGNRFGSGLGITTGDLASVMATGFGNGGSIRMTRPLKGDIIEARLTIQAVGGVQAPNTIRFGVGRFDTNGITAIAPTSLEIDQQMKVLYGSSGVINIGSQGNLFIDGLNITPLIPKRGETYFNEDGWVLYIDLTCKAPSEWLLYEFKVDCSVQIGVL